MKRYPTTVAQAKKMGLRVARLIRYFASDGNIDFELQNEAHLEYAYNWRKKPKKKK